jgi:hypothetical protein
MRNLIDKKFDFVVGSTTWNQVWNEQDLTEQISRAIQHTMFDWDFYYNWTDNKDEYLEILDKKNLAPMMESVEHTLENWFEFEGKKLRFKTENVDIDKWFMETNMSNELRKEYIDYRLEYAGINLNK